LSSASKSSVAGKAILVYVTDSKTKSKDIIKSIMHRNFPIPYTKEIFEKESTDGVSKVDRRTTCAYCNTEFKSRTKLFEHIRETGHELDSERPIEASGNKPQVLVIFDEDGNGSATITKAQASSMPVMKLLMLVPLPADFIITSIKCFSDAGDDEQTLYAARRYAPSSKSVQVKEIGLSFLRSITMTMSNAKEYEVIS
jgi:hypothetical protein